MQYVTDVKSGPKGPLFLYETEKKMSRREEYEKKAEELALPIIEGEGFEFVDVEYVKEAGEWYLRLYIDKEGGITIDDCENVSRRFSDALDREDFIDEAYVMEVSSPGLLRPLKKDRDFQRNIGKPVEIKTYKAVDGEKEFVGELEAFTPDDVTINTDGNKMNIDRKNISLIRQYIEF